MSRLAAAGEHARRRGEAQAGGRAEAHAQTRVEVLLDLDDRPIPARTWLASLWGHRDVLAVLARKDFQVRYKRASLGVLWAVVVPLVQAVVLVLVFSRIVRLSADGVNFGVFVLGGTLAFSYFSSTIGVSSTSIVDGAGLTDKVWFPRAVLPIVPALANLVGLGVSMAALIVSLPVLGVPIGPRLVLLVPACALLLTFTVALGLVLSALHVYFRDVRFLVQAALVIWFYVTPIVYPASLLGSLGVALDANPMTGVVGLFRLATVGPVGPWVAPVAVAVGVTVGLLAVGVQAHRRHDRLFVDLL